MGGRVVFVVSGVPGVASERELRAKNQIASAATDSSTSAAIRAGDQRVAGARIAAVASADPAAPRPCAAPTSTFGEAVVLISRGGTYAAGGCAGGA